MEQRLVLTQWSPLSHKELIGDAHIAGQPATRFWGPSWVPIAERRRLNAYIVRAAYIDNVARHLLPADTPDEVVKRHREYGDVAAFVDRVVASVLGDDWQIAVDGADDDLAEGPDLPPRPDAPANPVAPRPAAAPPGATSTQILAAQAALDEWLAATPITDRIAATRVAAWERDAVDAVDAWEARVASQPAARARQAALRRWADNVGLSARIHEGEHDAVGLADSVYVLWRRPGDWPTVEVYDPGCYFPDLDTVVRGEFPDGVFFAWEFDKAMDDGSTARWVRRLTFELVPIAPERTVLRRGITSWIGLDGEPLPEGEAPPLRDGETLGADGVIRRRLPWHGPDDLPAEVTCVFSDGEWPLAAVTAAKAMALDDSVAVWNTYREDWRCDFLPVIHNPNTPTGKEHFGRGIFDHEAQLLDDIATVDNRAMNGSRYLGAPTLGLEGASLPDAPEPRGRVWRGDRDEAPGAQHVAPGQIMTGKISAIDMSGGMDVLMKLGGDLRDRFLQNVGAPAELFGRVTGSTSQSTSAAHLALKYAPWAQVVAGLRLPRSPKYELLLKMAQRLAQLEQHPDGTPVLEPGPTPRARLLFGNFLPMNQADTVTMVSGALAAHAISRQTAVSLLVAGGISIDDARAELSRIEAEDTAGAVAVADALAGARGATEVVAARLGVEDRVSAPEPPVAPKITLSGHEAT